MFRRRKGEVAASVEPQEGAEAGSVEGPFEIDRFYLGEAGANYLEMQDLMNARVGEGHELVNVTPAGDTTQGSATFLVLVWRKP